MHFPFELFNIYRHNNCWTRSYNLICCILSSVVCILLSSFCDLSFSSIFNFLHFCFLLFVFCIPLNKFNFLKRQTLYSWGCSQKWSNVIWSYVIWSNEMYFFKKENTLIFCKQEITTG